METRNIILGRDAPLEKFFSLGFWQLYKDDRNVLFSAFLKTVRSENTTEQPQWWPSTISYQQEIRLTDLEKCDALAAILCNFNINRLENIFELNEVEGQLVTSTSRYMLADFFEARKAQIAIKSGELASDTIIDLTNYTKDHSNLSSPVKVFTLCRCHTQDMEHPELDYNLGVASLVNKHARCSYRTIPNRDQTLASSTYSHYANLEYDFSIEWAVYSRLGAFRPPREHSVVHFKDGNFDFQGTRNNAILALRHVTAIGLCILKYPIIGALLAVAPPETEFYIVYSIRNAISTSVDCPTNSPAEGWDKVSDHICSMEQQRRISSQHEAAIQ